jgi:hypothetical protein
MKRPTKPKPAPTVSAWDYAIIQTARDAQRRLQERNLSPEEVRGCLNLLRIGQDLVMRLQGLGTELPEIDLSYSPPATAATTSDVDGRETAAVKKLEQGAGR